MSKPATDYTAAINAQVLRNLPFNDNIDFENAQRGFISRPDTLVINDANGKVVWELESYKAFLVKEKPAPSTVNPSLWRHAMLNMYYGLFEVCKDIYQIRGYDLSNITFVKGETGWIVIDPLISPECAKAALAYINKSLGERPVVGVIYSHSHLDHYGGAPGIIKHEDAKSGKIAVISPEHFLEHAVSENVIAGNAMARRAVYMYGALLPRNEKGGVNAGLGMTVSMGMAGLIPPNKEVKVPFEEITVDGVRMIFQLTPGTEAPDEMNTYFPDLKALWMAENVTNTMHNVLTLRGAQVRDPLVWAGYIDETIEKWCDEAVVKFQSHHWPVWGIENIKVYMKQQRDIYKFIHDQSVRLMNHGYNGEEISDMIKLPKALNDCWHTRGYYGTLQHNSRAVYQRYMGWYNGNPCCLNNLPQEEAAKKYIEFMGGETEVLNKARMCFEAGEYRWVSEVLKHVVFANSDSKEGRELLADTLEQLGYQAESGSWRSVYLVGASELRNGLAGSGGSVSATPDTLRAMTPDMLFDFFAVRLNPEKAEGKVMRLNFDFTDLKTQYSILVENSVMSHSRKIAANPDVSLSLEIIAISEIRLSMTTFEDSVKDGKIKIDGNKEVLHDFMAMLDKFNFWFNIITP